MQGLRLRVCSDRRPGTEASLVWGGQVVGKVFVLSQDQLGCRFLQRQLEEGTQSSVNVIFQVGSPV